ncbi:MAG: rhodanese-like domain-containing protein [Alphaproteobacteria bacterium]
MVAAAVTAGICLAAGALWVASVTAPAAAFSPVDAYERSRQGQLVLVDVRTSAEWRETGIPVGALTIALLTDGGIPNIGFVDGVKDALGGRLDTPIAVICARGIRSSIAARLLRASGFSDVHDVSEGVIGWIALNLPLEARFTLP